MLSNLQTIHTPESIEEARALLERPDVRTMPLYGGPELFDDLARAAEMEEAVSLAGLGLDGVNFEPKSDLHIGALVTLAGLWEREPFIRQYRALPWELRIHTTGALRDAVKRTYSLNLRSMWTYGAVVAHGGAELPLLVVLVALNAHVGLAGKIAIPLEQYLLKRALTDIVTSVVVPMGDEMWESAPVHYDAVGRTPADAPIVCAAARAALDESGQVRQISLALGGVEKTAARAVQAEKALLGRMPDEAALEASLKTLDALEPPADFRGSTEYRREMAKVLARRVLRRALETKK